jgi:hypothetical protein
MPAGERRLLGQVGGLVVGALLCLVAAIIEIRQEHLQGQVMPITLGVICTVVIGGVFLVGELFLLVKSRAGVTRALSRSRLLLRAAAPALALGTGAATSLALSSLWSSTTPTYTQFVVQLIPGSLLCIVVLIRAISGGPVDTREGRRARAFLIDALGGPGRARRRARLILTVGLLLAVCLSITLGFWARQ